MAVMRSILAFTIIISLTQVLMGQENEERKIDWQGHRGARGLAPENAVPGFLRALSFEAITTLELDVVISADGKVVVSHEPWLNPKICLDVSGEPISGNEKINLYAMKYKSIKKCDCGSKGDSSFPEQIAVSSYKPLLSEVIREVKKYCKDRNRPLPRFNIEIKSNPAYDGSFSPQVDDFAEIVRTEIKRLKVEKKMYLQSFDVRVLRYLHKKEPDWVLAYLVEKVGVLRQQIDELGFKPAIYSPNFSKVTQATVEECHRLGMKIIPWTVNETAQMKKLLQYGVDGIITDYPNRIPSVSN
jgi:glycerophosphoryl diester phosphodiesterase